MTHKASDSDLAQIPAPPAGGIDSNDVSPNRSGAYLVLQSAGRWSDVFRLSPPGEAVIGRASSNQIVIRSDQASRRHARIAWSNEGWTIEDMGSRNGTFLNGQRLSESHPLRDGDMIEVAGFGIEFTSQIAGTAGPAPVASGSSQVTDDQITMEIDPDSITDRRRHSQYLHSAAGRGDADRIGLASSHLLQLAFTLARTEKTGDAIESVLDCLSEQITFTTAGVYLADAKAKKPITSTNDLTLAGTRQTGPRSYRRPPDSLVANVSGQDGQAVLARNVLGDREMATENSRGEIDVESLIIAPIRDRDNVLRGLVHLTTAASEEPLTGNDLEFIVAVAEILAASLAGLSTRKQLDRSLQRSRRQVRQLQEQLGDKVRIIGHSGAISNVVQQVSLAAPTNATVLIRGESGVGKELVAAAIHHASVRRDGPLVTMNCAALSPTLLESELFGHEKGAFTGATDRKQGKFEAADGGTLMLDEIGEMSAEIQAKFLRVLEGHPFERVGGHAPVKVDVRVVAATNRDLQSMVRDGKFRQDLFYRLHVVEIIVPPLRERGQDVIGLAEFFLDGFNKEMGRKISGFTDAAKKRLLDYSWPGNIRELKNVVERAVVLNTETVIDEHDLALAPAVEGGTATSPEIGAAAVETTLAALERAHIERVLRHTGGNKSKAASILGIERSTLDRKLKKFAAE